MRARSLRSRIQLNGNAVECRQKPQPAGSLVYGPAYNPSLPYTGWKEVGSERIGVFRRAEFARGKSSLKFHPNATRDVGNVKRERGREGEGGEKTWRDVELASGTNAHTNFVVRSFICRGRTKAVVVSRSLNAGWKRDVVKKLRPGPRAHRSAPVDAHALPPHQNSRIRS